MRPGAGRRARPFHVLQHLSRWASVHLAHPVGRLSGEESLATFRPFCVRAMLCDSAQGTRTLMRTVPGLTSDAGRLPPRPYLAEVVRKWVGEIPFHAAVVATTGALVALPSPALRGVPVLLDVSELRAGSGTGENSSRPSPRRLATLGLLGAKARAVTLPTEAEVEAFQAFCPHGEVFRVPDGVDVSHYRPPQLPTEEDGCLLIGEPADQADTEALGWFCQQVWPAVLHRLPRLCLRVPAVRSARPAVSGVPGIKLVPSKVDPRPAFAAAAVVVAPFPGIPGRSAGTLEALAMGKAVVASDEALDGLPDRLDAPVLLASSVPEWVDHITRLVGDRSLRAQLGLAGRRYAESHSWDHCLRAMDVLLGVPPRSPDPQPALQPPHFRLADTYLGR